jgi:hypothetical protein
MDSASRAKKIGHHIGYLFIFGVIMYGAQLHRFFPFIGPAIGISGLLVVIFLMSRAYGKSNEPKLEGLEGDELLAQQVRIAIVIRRWALAFALLSFLSFFLI